MKRIDLTGMRFGRLTAIRLGKPHVSPSRCQITWICLCDCGNYVTIQRGSLRSGTTSSCGCKYQDAGAKRRKGKFFHAPEYNTWTAMKQRCGNPNNPEWHNYGGRGIKIWPAWEESFHAFLLDMGKRPTPAHSIERIEKNGNYEPGNCEWATPYVQSRNRRNNRVLELDGEVMVLSDWAVRIGITPATLSERLSRFDTRTALTTPKGARHGT